MLCASWVQTEFWLQAGGMVLSLGWVLGAECRLSAKFRLCAEYRFSVERWISDGCRQSAGWGPYPAQCFGLRMNSLEEADLRH